MHFGIYKQIWYCRWCGVVYKPKEQTDRDGFCCPAHKSAWHRHFKKYSDRTLRLKEIQGKRPGRVRNASKRRAKK